MKKEDERSFFYFKMVQKTLMLQFGFNRNTRKTHQNTVYYNYKTYKKVKYVKTPANWCLAALTRRWFRQQLFWCSFPKSSRLCYSQQSAHRQLNVWLHGYSTGQSDDCGETPCKLTDTSFSIQTLQRWEIALKLNVELSFSSSSSEEMGLLVVSCLP